jgi:hypothetical protein
MKSRKTIELRERFNKRWLGYATAAGAAGVGMLAASQPAQADIIYTPANIHLTVPGGIGTAQASIAFDNGQDFDVFVFNRAFPTYCSWCVGHEEVFGDVYTEVGASGRALNAGPLPKGFKIGSMGSAPKSASLMGWVSRGVPSSRRGTFKSISSAGPWAGQQGYLGVKFDLNGQIHYGWVAGKGEGTEFDITGWAYNTIANAPIDAGQGATPEPGTLGLLALGSLGLGFWRRRKVVGGRP